MRRPTEIEEIAIRALREIRGKESLGQVFDNKKERVVEVRARRPPRDPPQPRRGHRES